MSNKLHDPTNNLSAQNHSSIPIIICNISIIPCQIPSSKNNWRDEARNQVNFDEKEKTK